MACEQNRSVSSSNRTSNFPHPALGGCSPVCIMIFRRQLGVATDTIRAVSFHQLLTGVFGGVSFSGFGVFFPEPSSDSRLHLSLQLGEHSRAVAVMKVSSPPSHSLINPSNALFRLLP